MNLRVVLILGIVLSLPAAAQWQGITGKIGIDRGGLVLGGEYSIKDTALEGFSGYLSIHQKDPDAGAPSLTAIGGAFRLTLQKGPYHLFLSPGIGFVDYELGLDDGLLIGPRMSYGFHAEMDRRFSMGVENQKLYSWLGDVKGLIADNFLITFVYAL